MAGRPPAISPSPADVQQLILPTYRLHLDHFGADALDAGAHVQELPHAVDVDGLDGRLRSGHRYHTHRRTPPTPIALFPSTPLLASLGCCWPAPGEPTITRGSRVPAPVAQNRVRATATLLVETLVPVVRTKTDAAPAVPTVHTNPTATSIPTDSTATPADPTAPIDTPLPVTTNVPATPTTADSTATAIPTGVTAAPADPTATNTPTCGTGRGLPQYPQRGGKSHTGPMECATPLACVLSSGASLPRFSCQSLTSC